MRCVQEGLHRLRQPDDARDRAGERPGRHAGWARNAKFNGRQTLVDPDERRFAPSSTFSSAVATFSNGIHARIARSFALRLSKSVIALEAPDRPRGPAGTAGRARNRAGGSRSSYNRFGARVAGAAEGQEAEVSPPEKTRRGRRPRPCSSGILAARLTACRSGAAARTRSLGSPRGRDAPGKTEQSTAKPSSTRTSKPTSTAASAKIPVRETCVRALPAILLQARPYFGRSSSLNCLPRIVEIRVCTSEWRPDSTTGAINLAYQLGVFLRDRSRRQKKVVYAVGPAGPGRAEHPWQLAVELVDDVSCRTASCSSR